MKKFQEYRIKEVSKNGSHYLIERKYLNMWISIYHLNIILITVLSITIGILDFYLINNIYPKLIIAISVTTIAIILLVKNRKKFYFNFFLSDITDYINKKRNKFLKKTAKETYKLFAVYYDDFGDIRVREYNNQEIRKEKLLKIG